MHPSSLMNRRSSARPPGCCSSRYRRCSRGARALAADQLALQAIDVQTLPASSCSSSCTCRDRRRSRCRSPSTIRRASRSTCRTPRSRCPRAASTCSSAASTRARRGSQGPHPSGAQPGQAGALRHAASTATTSSSCSVRPAGRSAGSGRRLGRVRAARRRLARWSARIRTIDFRRGADGTGRVIVQALRSAHPDQRAPGRQPGRRRLRRRDVPKNLMRRYDAIDFATPVTSFDVIRVEQRLAHRRSPPTATSSSSPTSPTTSTWSRSSRAARRRTRRMRSRSTPASG